MVKATPLLMIPRQQDASEPQPGQEEGSHEELWRESIPDGWAHSFEGSPLGVAALWSPVSRQGGPAHDGPLCSPWLQDSRALASEVTVLNLQLLRDKKALIGRVRIGPHLGVISPWG